MLYLAIIYHMHQPYYKNILTGEMSVPWVRLHGTKDYLDMLLILKDYPEMRLTFNLTPCLVEQIEDYVSGSVQDRHLSLSYKPAEELNREERQFILEHFFSIFLEYNIAIHPRYYQLYLKRQSQQEFTVQDLRDLQVWFNLAWTDSYFRQNNPQLKQLILKGRFFTEDDKEACLDVQFDILKQIIPAYKEYQSTGQIELITNPYYHPILPLLFNSMIAKEANPKAVLPKKVFNYPQDAESQIREAIEFYEERFHKKPLGMWPSEEAVSEHILDLIIKAGVDWIVTDEAILYKSLRKRKRNTSYLYKPYQLKREEGAVNIVFRDRNLSDLISFVYHKWKPKDAVDNFLNNLKNIEQHFEGEDPLVVVALDGENAWEYYRNDGWDFLSLLYERLSSSDFLRTTTVSDYLGNFPPEDNIIHLKPGSWVNGDFNKWIGSEPKNKAWECLIKAREELGVVMKQASQAKDRLTWKQLFIAEGSDWFWWYGDTQDKTFDELFRMHMSNLYQLLGKSIPKQLSSVIT